MKFPEPKKRRKGTAVPVSALRSQESEGVGDFTDLPRFARWCRQSGLEVIQILPVNDTGYTTSPYSAISAFALHPLYLHIQSLPGGETETGAVRGLKALDSSKGVSYRAVLAGKLRIAERLFERFGSLDEQELDEWIEGHPWIRPYAVYRVLKERASDSWWHDFGKYSSRPEQATIDTLWNELAPRTRFFSWLQMHLDRQLTEAGAAVNELGLLLKGDIPILMSEDSADVWYDRDLFRLDLKAGAPPDGFNAGGQNWGFPLYNWESKEEQILNWWRARLRQAEKYYHAYRLDHVLGFFRIWGIPKNDHSAAMGHYLPAAPISENELIKAGFDKGRIVWLSRPHIPEGELIEELGEHSGQAANSVLERVENEDLFRFHPDHDSEAAIRELGLDEQAENALLLRYRDRTLLQLEDGSFVPTWSFRESRAWQNLFEEERRKLEKLILKKHQEGEKKWEKQGQRLLGALRDESGMLVCAEDLGSIPQSVPQVLETLDILSLRINRWHRRYEEPGAPVVPLEEYPERAVITLSVHDTSSLRGWWLEETEKERFWESFGFSGPPPQELGGEDQEKIIRAESTAPSRLCILQLQDILGMNTDIRPSDPSEEQINQPGTMNSKNWSYRMPINIEKLQEYDEFSSKIRTALKR
ncbi:MAG: 4-alpha-glucanotransferase [Spirochaetales bacterium]|nr:4-alpha-glucanotransferase [Spirochaetales bacterium]MCF7938617.1 4-alpha-glucanotransferase [Spirochaetales bacterium]